MLSAYNGHLECSKMLITQGANVNESNDHGHSILAGVAFKGYLSICRLLVENGALIDRRPLKDPILFAFIFGRRDVVNYLQSQTKPRKIHNFLSKPLFLLKKLKK
jgi:ankyrin repeat protein